jgi:hypothetical protein
MFKSYVCRCSNEMFVNFKTWLVSICYSDLCQCLQMVVDDVYVYFCCIFTCVCYYLYVYLKYCMHIYTYVLCIFVLVLALAPTRLVTFGLHLQCRHAVPLGDISGCIQRGSQQHATTRHAPLALYDAATSCKIATRSSYTTWPCFHNFSTFWKHGQHIQQTLSAYAKKHDQYRQHKLEQSSNTNINIVNML